MPPVIPAVMSSIGRWLSAPRGTSWERSGPVGAAALRTPVVLDGVIAGAAALVANALHADAPAAWVAGHRSAEPGHAVALDALGLRPLVALDLRLGEGTGALLALPLVQSAVRALAEVATFDTAGVTEK